MIKVQVKFSDKFTNILKVKSDVFVSTYHDIECRVKSIQSAPQSTNLQTFWKLNQS